MIESLVNLYQKIITLLPCDTIDLGTSFKEMIDIGDGLIRDHLVLL